MAEASPAPTTPAPDSSIETLKRLREVETQGDRQVAEAHADVEARLEQQRRAGEEAIGKAQAEADQLHDAMVAAARRETDAGVERIVEAGREEASRVGFRSGKTLDAVRDPILDALFAEFRGSSSSED